MSLLPLARSCYVIISLFFCCSSLSAQTVLYVNQENVSPGTGLTWATSFDNITAAIDAANLDAAVAEIWVAQGIYYPSNTGNQNEFWLWPDGVSLFGGFIGNESDKTQSDPTKNPTILDGNLGDIASVLDNSLNLIAIENPSEDLEINGLTFQNAGTSTTSNGHGLNINYSNNLDSADLIISNCIFKNNLSEKGAAIHIAVTADSYSNAQIDNCIFIANQAANGGALAFEKNEQSILEIEILNGWFKGNQAERGGAVWGAGVNGTTPDLLEWNAEFLNCLFTNNSADRGGALYFKDSGSQFSGRAQNCTFYGNNSNVNGHSIYLGFNGGGEFVNNIHWGESTADESIFFTLNDGNLSVSHVMMNNLFSAATNVISGEPMFFSAAEDDFRLKICSDAINAGNNFGLPGSDFRGAVRQYETILDLGAYEMDGSEIILSPATANSNTANRWITDPDGWSHYVDCNTNSRLISLQTDGQNIGTPGINNFNVAIETDAEYGNIGIDLTNADYFLGGGFFIANRRFWKVENANAFANPIRLRFYFNEQDITDIATLAGESISLEALQPFKVSGDNAFALDVMTGGGSFQSFDYSVGEGAGMWTVGQSGGADYMEFSVSSFSAGAIGFNDQNGLPLELVDFTGQPAGTRAILNWTTQSEEAFSHFEIQRSFDQLQFETIGQQSGAGFSTTSRGYTFVDDSPSLNTNYYRLKMVDQDGRFEYSPIVNISFGNFSKEDWRVFPNPVSQMVNVILPPSAYGPLQLRLFNSQGQLIKEISLQDYQGDRVSFSIKEIPTGIYFIAAKGRRINEYNQLIKIAE